MLYLNIIICILTIGSYSSAFVPPSEFWVANLISLSIPLFLIMNLFFIIFWIFKIPKYLVFSLSTLIIGSSFIKSTFSINLSAKEDNNVDIKILNYNVRGLNRYHLEYKDSIIQWIENDTSDVKCIQEYYGNNNDTLKSLLEKQNYKSHIKTVSQNNNYGLAIFSKYAIMNNGSIHFDTIGGYNFAIYSDIITKKGAIRIINVHLSSINISSSKKSLSNMLNHYKEISIKHEKQVHKINDLIVRSPYPTIVCIDLNSLPYDYAYIKLKKHLKNGFEKAGRGFGPSYNNIIPLRIDNQFYSESITAVNYTIFSDIAYSDHYPAIGGYIID